MKPAKEVELVAAYYIPAATGVNSFIALARNGIRLRVLTNSLSAADGPRAFSGYANAARPCLKPVSRFTKAPALAAKGREQERGPARQFRLEPAR